MEKSKRVYDFSVLAIVVVVATAAVVWKSRMNELHAADHRDAGFEIDAPAAAPIPPDIAVGQQDRRPESTEQVAPESESTTVSAGNNSLRTADVDGAYPQTGEPHVSQTALLRAADAQPGGPDTMLDGNLLLVEAHEVAAKAASIEDFTRIVDLCHAGLQAGVSTDAAEFARQLTAWAYNRRGEAHDLEGEAKKALVDFNAAVQSDPQRWRAIHNRGVSLAQMGRLQEAFNDFTRTIELQPRHAKAYSNRAAIHEQRSKFQLAQRDYGRAIELNHTFATAYSGLGRVLGQMGRPQDALLAMDEAVRLDNENPAFLTSRGDVYASLGDYESALLDYGKAIEVDPSFALAYRNGSWLLATCPDGRFRDAENAIVGAEKAVELAFDELHLYLDTLAACYAAGGDFDQATATMQQSIDDAPQRLRPFLEQRLTLYRTGRPFRMPAVQQASFEQAE